MSWSVPCAVLRLSFAALLFPSTLLAETCAQWAAAVIQRESGISVVLTQPGHSPETIQNGVVRTKEFKAPGTRRTVGQIHVERSSIPATEQPANVILTYSGIGREWNLRPYEDGFEKIRLQRLMRYGSEPLTPSLVRTSFDIRSSELVDLIQLDRETLSAASVAEWRSYSGEQPSYIVRLEIVGSSGRSLFRNCLGFSRLEYSERWTSSDANGWMVGAPSDPPIDSRIQAGQFDRLDALPRGVENYVGNGYLSLSDSVSRAASNSDDGKTVLRRALLLGNSVIVPDQSIAELSHELGIPGAAQVFTGELRTESTLGTRASLEISRGWNFGSYQEGPYSPSLDIFQRMSRSYRVFSFCVLGVFALGMLLVTPLVIIFGGFKHRLLLWSWPPTFAVVVAVGAVVSSQVILERRSLLNLTEFRISYGDWPEHLIMYSLLERSMKAQSFSASTGGELFFPELDPYSGRSAALVELARSEAQSKVLWTTPKTGYDSELSLARFDRTPPPLTVGEGDQICAHESLHQVALFDGRFQRWHDIGDLRKDQCVKIANAKTSVVAPQILPWLGSFLQSSRYLAGSGAYRNTRYSGAGEGEIEVGRNLFIKDTREHGLYSGMAIVLAVSEERPSLRIELDPRKAVLNEKVVVMAQVPVGS